ncbi:selenium cofactor biosynthesis protein YqeC [Halosolutus gelatinilyticus]|uniref:selenium cofactor biosynthesis protein YqeC n=1 Tax=Halosolutus gelatinilyticus TaxID=2931975 RepID=UPI001FF184E0|nr:selenium cofactor biosynthesis protein YqeC [Halosolutus gelatinilyticus]
MDLTRALGADAGLTCVVGAGGKKSALYELADRLDRAVLTATVRIPIFDRRVATVRVTDDPVGVLSADRTDAERDREWPLGLVADRDGDDRYVGYDPAVVDEIAAAGAADHVLVKADGARTRLLKAPGDHEPQLPATADAVLAIASVHAVGEPLDERAVHRPERVAAVTGRSPGESIEPADVATLLTSPEAGLKGVPDGATYVPVLNMVDDDEDLAIAREIARSVLDRNAGAHDRVSRVALTSMIADEPLVDVVG